MRESRSSGSVEGVMSDHDPYSDSSESWSVCAAKFTRPGEEPTLLSRWEKSGRGGTDGETVKLLDGIQRVKVPPGHSRADRPVASVAHLSGDRWVLSVHSKETGCEDQLR